MAQEINKLRELLILAIVWVTACMGEIMGQMMGHVIMRVAHANALPWEIARRAPTRKKAESAETQGRPQEKEKRAREYIYSISPLPLPLLVGPFAFVILSMNKFLRTTN